MKLQKLQILDGSILKLLAVVTMFIDHAALILLPCIPALRVPLFAGCTAYTLLRKIGRLAFPLFCFLLAEGFFHSKDRLRYSLRLMMFALISELPFNLMVSGRLFFPDSQNVYFTLFLGVCALWVLTSDLKIHWKLLILVPGLVLLPYLHTDYGRNGVLLIVLLYLLREKPLASCLVSFPLLSGGFAAWLAFVPMGMYNGKRGFITGNALKYAFYAFYPVHMLLLLGIRYLL